MWTPKNSDFDTLRAPKKHKIWGHFLMQIWSILKKMGTSSAYICFVFLLRSWCHFSSSAVALLVGISKFKHIYEAELQLSTRFPFHCQDRFLLSSFLELFSRSEKVSKKRFQRVPKGTPKVDPNRHKGHSGGVWKRDLKRGPSPGPGKVRFCYYLLHFSKVGGLKKYTFLGTMLGQFGRQNRWNGGPDK